MAKLLSLCGGSHENDYVPGVRDDDDECVPAFLGVCGGSDHDVRGGCGRALHANAASDHARRVSGHGEHDQTQSCQSDLQ